MDVLDWLDIFDAFVTVMQTIRLIDLLCLLLLHSNGSIRMLWLSIEMVENLVFLVSQKTELREVRPDVG
jgi:hypothetical protein